MLTLPQPRPSLRSTSDPPSGRQLPLPLPVPAVALVRVAPARLGVAATDVAVRRVWVGLPPPMRTHLRRTALRILREVVGDAGGG
jgi:hypothetical protein